MPITPFKLERYFAQYEFKVQHLLSPSDCEALSLQELLQIADDQCRALWQNLRLGYTESTGHPLLRQEISQLYSTITAEHILVAAPEEAIYIAMHSLLRPGDHVISVFPAYQSLYEIARSLSCTVSFWEAKPADNCWQFDLQDLEDLIQPNTRLLVINFPHNPTGFLPSLSQYQQVIDIARSNKLMLFSDEMYRFLEYTPSDQLPPACDLYDNALSLGGLSKSFALPGLRIGWLASCSKDLLNPCAVYKDYTTICSSAPSEILGLIALRNRGSIFQRNLAIIQHNLQTANQFFHRWSNLLAWLPPQAGSIALASWKGDISFAEVCRQLLDDKGLMVLPGEVFDLPANTFRLGLGRTSFSLALSQFDVWLSETLERLA
ncbi:MAG: aminotransferase class I/II-fold pyridoxal phosphate-dependent enzyme [Chloroflexota bacterium]